MDTVIKVKLWDKDVAAVVWDKDKEYAVVEFYESFGKEGFDIAPLMMPLGDVLRGDKIFFFPAHRGNTYKGLPGIFADSLPDDYGNSVIDEWFASRNIPIEITPLDRLCYVGRRGMGALEYEPANEDATLNESSLIEITHLAALANEVLNHRKNFRTKSREGGKTFTDILKVGTSAGGAKPKAIIAFDEQTKEIRSGQVSAPAGFTYWLLKFDGVGDNNLNDNPIGIGRIEYAYYKMAIAANIKMSECQLLYDANMAH
ncbi:MAG: type II toxin-antitoxin system HipA family toxin, partial [Bacteroidales bacterium]|nr:type II toxin-antitoxin system HipA family toxin [Bacteroidales bacterium]